MSMLICTYIYIWAEIIINLTEMDIFTVLQILASIIICWAVGNIYNCQVDYNLLGEVSGKRKL